MSCFIEIFVYIISILGIILSTYFLTVTPYYLNTKRFLKNITSNGKKYITITFKNIDDEKVKDIMNKINDEKCKDKNINVKIYKIIDKK